MQNKFVVENMASDFTYHDAMHFDTMAEARSEFAKRIIGLRKDKIPGTACYLGHTSGVVYNHYLYKGVKNV